jgi:CheY-like chemotaxis protein
MRKLILIVDDEFIILESLRIQLERFLPDEIEIETAHSGSEAAEVLEDIAEKGHQLLLVISDHNLGDIKGTEVLLRVKQLFPKTPRILLSGQAGTDKEMETYTNEKNLDLYITKPWEIEELKSRIENFTGSGK